MLGSCIVLFGVPVALTASLFAFARGADRPFAITALVLSGLEALLLSAVLALSFLAV